MIFHCAQLYHPPTHWQIFFTRRPSDCFAINFPGRAISPGEGLPILLTSLQGSGQGCPLLRASNEHRFTVRVLRARRAPGRSLPILLRPRVARAQKIIRLHPLLCSASTRDRPDRPSPPFFGYSYRPCLPGHIRARTMPLAERGAGVGSRSRLSDDLRERAGVRSVRS